MKKIPFTKEDRDIITTSPINMDALSPYARGFVTFSLCMDKSYPEVQDNGVPFPVGTPYHTEYLKGVQDAYETMLEVGALQLTAKLMMYAEYLKGKTNA